MNLDRDERHVAVSSSPTGWLWNIWVLDLTRAGAATKVTSGPGHQFDPVWSPDGKHLIFNSNKTGWSSLFRRASDGSGGDELLVPSLRNATLPDWSHDGRFLVYSSRDDLWTLPLSVGGEPGTPSVFLQTSADEGAGVFSPDGRWIAYESNATGRYEVYVRPFPVKGGLSKISLDGGRRPRWRGSDGKELFFVAPDGTLMSAGIDAATELRATVPQRLFKAIGATDDRYAVTKDGKRFLIRVGESGVFSGSTPITIVVNWPAKIRK